MTNIRNPQRFIYLCIALVLLAFGLLGAPGADADPIVDDSAPGAALQARNLWNDMESAVDQDEPPAEEERAARVPPTEERAPPTAMADLA